jgi:hypothetical protein
VAKQQKVKCTEPSHLMFDSISDQKSRLVTVAQRAILCFGAGLILTFTVPAFLDALPSSSFVVLLAQILNLPAVIYCKFAKLPETLPEADVSMYCWSVGFLLNIPYYSVIVYLLAWLFARRRRQQ